jgi:carbon starvation protein
VLPDVGNMHGHIANLRVVRYCVSTCEPKPQSSGATENSPAAVEVCKTAPAMTAAPILLGALCTLAVAYRYYGAFLAARVLVLDANRVTPAVTFADGQNFHKTSKLVLFGHHFAAITGAGPLIGPVLAAQFGFLPGFLWILFGVCLGGAVHDFVILVASVRRGGRSLAEIAREELGSTLGLVTAIAILFIVVIALAGLGNVVVAALAESAWGVFTVSASIPIALAMGLYIYKVRGGSARGVREASAFGVVLLLVALVVGKSLADSSLGAHLRLSKLTLTLGIACYGFVASVLPVWMLLCPRDYLSSYLKIGTIALLVVGVVVVNPRIEMPATTVWIAGGGPVVKGPVFPFVFITIACGAISGFHALVATGTTPKMVGNERDCRAIGYGAMLMEGLVAITALIAACILPQNDYIAVNTDPEVALIAIAGKAGLAHDEAELARALSTFTTEDRKRLGLPTSAERNVAGMAHDMDALRGRNVRASVALALSNPALAALGYSVDPKASRATSLDDHDFARLGIAVTDLPALSRAADEVVASRTGGAVSLAVGMARVFSGLPGMRSLLAYWYHFAIMFEALFVLTTIDTGTRIGRFLLQEFFGRIRKEWGEPKSTVGGVVATLLVVSAWSYFILTGSIQTIWPMFGIANQLLACTALCVATSILLREAKLQRYALVTALPLAFVSTTTLTAAFYSVRMIYWPLTQHAATRTTGVLSVCIVSGLASMILAVLVGSTRRWLRTLAGPRQRTSLI